MIAAVYTLASICANSTFAKTLTVHLEAIYFGAFAPLL